ncbi:RNA polymerase sigma factor [Planomonospora parontospora subsp. parontospora]|uniref:RNA polymerase sigma factor n=2 Tax=Planomonospora parontospora TaxID=58119 RepID=A0AA37F498_9ACTN|nr:RNA polymerase subunit sigma-70 [Planomonospora parontospora]GGK63527.1 RNA polymerase sigma factor [Planomonospora parontospora]GII08197.1 RNA polymerase sigma factor [Planomonospora parontospora subsp. parontospora]
MAAETLIGNGFAERAEAHRRELHVHCYRMLGSFDEAEDLVQETFLRAWRRRDTLRDGDGLRAWLYRIATNACLDHLRAHPRRPEPRPAPAGADPGLDPPASGMVSWLQPYPDELLDAADLVIERETIELAFLVAIQHLPPRQRAVLILRDVLGWSAQETAESLELTVAAVKSALQRARPVLRRHLPARRLEWAASAGPTPEDRAVLRRYIDAVEQADPSILTEVLRADVWQAMPPAPIWLQGLETFVAAWTPAMTGPEAWGDWRVLAVRANRQPAAAAYLRRAGETCFSPSWLGVLRLEDGLVTQITTFGDEMFPSFGLPASL